MKVVKILLLMAMISTVQVFSMEGALTDEPGSLLHSGNKLPLWATLAGDLSGGAIPLPRSAPGLPHHRRTGSIDEGITPIGIDDSGDDAGPSAKHAVVSDPLNTARSAPGSGEEDTGLERLAAAIIVGNEDKPKLLAVKEEDRGNTGDFDEDSEEADEPEPSLPADSSLFRGTTVTGSSAENSGILPGGRTASVFASKLPQDIINALIGEEDSECALNKLKDERPNLAAAIRLILKQSDTPSDDGADRPAMQMGEKGAPRVVAVGDGSVRSDTPFMKEIAFDAHFSGILIRLFSRISSHSKGVVNIAIPGLSAEGRTLDISVATEIKRQLAEYEVSMASEAYGLKKDINMALETLGTMLDPE